MLACLGAMIQAASAPAADRCEHQVLANQKLHVTPDGAVFMPARLAGREVYFQLAIGAGLPEIGEGQAAALGLKPRRINGSGRFWRRGQQITHFVSLQGMSVGDAQLATRAALLIPASVAGPAAEIAGSPIVGLMGSTLFQNLDAELHLAARELKLFRRFKCLSRSPAYWGGEIAELPLRFDEAGALVVTLQLNGKRIETGLLGSSRESIIDANATQQFFGFGEEQGADGANAFHAMSLTGPGLTIENFRVQMRRFTNCKLTGSTTVYHAIGYADCVNMTPFTLGTELLEHMRLYISSERDKVYASIVAQPAIAQGE
jgi:hypothetical protein